MTVSSSIVSCYGRRKLMRATLMAKMLCLMKVRQRQYFSL